MTNTTAFRVNAAVGILWIGIGLRDLILPHLFRFDGRVAATSMIILDFAVGAVFLFVALSFYLAKPRALKSKP